MIVHYHQVVRTESGLQGSGTLFSKPMQLFPIDYGAMAAPEVFKRLFEKGVIYYCHVARFELVSCILGGRSCVPSLSYVK